MKIYVVADGKPVRIDDKPVFTQCDSCGKMTESTLERYLDGFVKIHESTGHTASEFIDLESYCYECSRELSDDEEE